jgi:hypothetical protein
METIHMKNSNGTWIECVECGLRSPVFYDVDEAWAWWDTRPVENALRAQLAEARALLSAVVEEHQSPGAHGEIPYPYPDSPETRAFAACDICHGAMEWLAANPAT